MLERIHKIGATLIQSGREGLIKNQAGLDQHQRYHCSESTILTKRASRSISGQSLFFTALVANRQ